MEPVNTIEAPKSGARRYVKVEKGEFIRIANEEGTIKGIVAKTGMTYSGVYLRLRAMKKAKVSLKATLFQRQKRTKKVVEEKPAQLG